MIIIGSAKPNFLLSFNLCWLKVGPTYLVLCKDFVQNWDREVLISPHYFQAFVTINTRKPTRCDRLCQASKCLPKMGLFFLPAPPLHSLGKPKTLIKRVTSTLTLSTQQMDFCSAVGGRLLLCARNFNFSALKVWHFEKHDVCFYGRQIDFCSAVGGRLLRPTSSLCTKFNFSALKVWHFEKHDACF